MNIVKALGIIAVVLGHSDSPFHNFVYLYHMSLFFFISGYFYKDSYSANPFSLIKKRIKSLYIPYLFCALLFLVLHNVFFKLNIYSSEFGFDNVHSRVYEKSDFLFLFSKAFQFQSVELLLGAIWFIQVLFVVSISFCLLSSFVSTFIKKHNEYIRFTVLLLLFVVGMINEIKGIILPYMLNLSMISLFVFYIGYLFRKIEHKVPFNFFFALTSVFLLIANSYFGNVNMIDNKFTSPAFFLVCSLLGIYANIYAAKWINQHVKSNILNYVGESSMYILILHFLAFKISFLPQIYLHQLPISILGKFPTIDGSHVWWIPYTIAGVFIPVSVRWIAQNAISKIQSIKTVKRVVEADH